MNQYLYLSILWMLWCFLHSLFIASAFVKKAENKMGDSFRYYRLIYNLFAFISLVPIYLYTRSLYIRPFWVWDGTLLIVKYLLLFTGFALLWLGAKSFSMKQFIGISQVLKGNSFRTLNKKGDISSSGVLRYIRHPWYTSGILLIWSQDFDITRLIVAFILTIYLLLGAFIEERKLLNEFGDSYKNYRKNVSMFFPVKFIRKKFNI